MLACASRIVGGTLVRRAGPRRWALAAQGRRVAKGALALAGAMIASLRAANDGHGWLSRRPQADPSQNVAAQWSMEFVGPLTGHRTASGRARPRGPLAGSPTPASSATWGATDELTGLARARTTLVGLRSSAPARIAGRSMRVGSEPAAHRSHRGAISFTSSYLRSIPMAGARPPPADQVTRMGAARATTQAWARSIR
jgi:hypothetical protein